jgi:hypothetical protein
MRFPPAAAFAFSLLLLTSPARLPDPVSPPAREAAAKAIAWLLLAQNTDGSWGDNQQTPGQVGNTAIATLALMSHGSSTSRGPNSFAVRRGIDWLARRTRNYGINSLLDSNTLLQGKLGNNADLYLVALLYTQAANLNLEAWEDVRMHTELRSMVQRIASLQQASGEWETSYEPMLTTIAAWQALKQAHAIGVHTSQASVEKVIRYLRDHCLEQTTGIFREEKWGRAERFVTQAGGVRVLVGESLGNQPEVQRAIDVIGRMRFDQDVGGAQGGEEFLGALYAVQALLLQRAPVYANWYERITQALRNCQNRDGSWVGHHCITGRVFCTSCAIMTLLTPDKLLPLVER